MRVRIFIGLAVVTGLLALYLVRSAKTERRAEDSGPAADDVASALADLRNEVLALKRGQGAQQQRHAALLSAVAKTQETNEAEPADDATSESQEPGLEPAVPDHAQVLENLEDGFHTLAPDQSWGRTAVGTVTEQVRAHFKSGARLESVECRAGVCRAELTHPELASLREEGNTFAIDHREWEGTKILMLRTEEGETPARAVIYMAKQGVDPTRLAMAGK